MTPNPMPTPPHLIGINARYLLTERPTGVQRAAAALARALVAEDPDRYRLFVPEGRRCGRVQAQLWEQGALSRRARREGCGVLLNPIQTSPLAHRGVRQVVVVHDLHFLHHPQWFGGGFRWWNRLVTVRALRRADHVVAISDHVLADIRRTCGIPADRSARIYNIGPQWTKTPERQRTTSILCVNAYQPHKNLARVLTAFRRLRWEFPELEIRLVGRPQENFAAIPGLKQALNAPGVRVLGYVSDEALAEEYGRCAVFCYASLSEGFGLPVLEAAAAGAVVVASQVPALREIAADAALFVDPLRTESIADGLRQALGLSEASRAEFIARGRKNLQRFSAESVVGAYAHIFARVLRNEANPVRPSSARRPRVAD